MNREAECAQAEAARKEAEEAFIEAANEHNKRTQQYLDGQQVKRETLDLIISV
jgi:hypothetical protein